MTDATVNLHHQGQSTPEEGDITEAAGSVIQVAAKPTLVQQERVHSTDDSESEEDLTEENVHNYDTNNLTRDMENLHTDTSATVEENDNIPQETDTLPPLNPTDTLSPTPPSPHNRPTATTSSPTSTSPAATLRGRSASSVSPSTLHSGLLPRSQRVWEMDRQAPECRRCHRRFNFLVRRHHCRRCGQIVCDKCSSHRIRLPVEELIEDPMVSPSQYPLLASQSQRVCDTCYREPIRRSSESHSRRTHRSRPAALGSQMRRTDSSQSLMIDCPVCGSTFLGMQKNEQEEHLQRCLNVGSPPVQSPRYIVYQLSQDSTQVGDECPICFEEFEEGDKVSRMICLCSYHQQCLASWLQKGKGCPVHYDSLQV